MSAQALESLIRLLGDPADASVVADPVSWALIRKYSGVYGVGALAAFAARPFVSGEDRAWCDQVLTSNWRRYEQSLLHLEGILALLDKAGVQALVLKGPLLARRHYKPAFLRKPSGDVDLAIRPEDFDRACDAMTGANYEPGLSRAEAKKCSHHLYFLHATLPRVELHFRISQGPFGIPVEEFFERAIPSQLPNGGTAWVLDGTDEVLHLVLHLAQHRFPLLFNLDEIRRIWRVTPVAVRKQAIQKAYQHHCLAVFAMTDIAFRSTWSEAFLPDDVELPKTWLHGALNERLFRECVRWSQPGYQLTLSNRMKGRWLDFQVTDRPSDALRFLTTFANVAWYRLRHKGWRRLEYSHRITASGSSRS